MREGEGHSEDGFFSTLMEAWLNSLSQLGVTSQQLAAQRSMAEGHFSKLLSMPPSADVLGSFSFLIHSAALSVKILHYLLNVLSVKHVMLANSLLVSNLRHLFLTMAPMSSHFSLHVLWILHSLLTFFFIKYL